MRRYVVVLQTSESISVVLITHSHEKAERKAKKITNLDYCQYGYVCAYDKPIPNRMFIIK